MEWYIRVIMNTFNFAGRARRKEYWMFFVIHIGVVFGLTFFTTMLKLPPTLVGVYSLGIIIPSLSVGLRRIHDSGHSGWWMWIPFYNLYLFAIEGTPGDNAYGPDPKATVSAIAPPVE